MQDYSKKLRKEVYQIDESIKASFPAKNTEDNLEKEIAYCRVLVEIVKQKEEIVVSPKVKEKSNRLEETLQDDMEHLALSNDEDAKVGHKTSDISFFGYKTYIAMTEERIITAATITTGEKNDRKELETLYNKSNENGLEIDTVIGDAVYSEKGNIELTEKEEINLVAKLNPSVTQGTRKKEDEFQFNKDVGIYVCKA